MRNWPPSDLNSREPLIQEAREGELWCRGHQVSLGAVYFGRGKSQRWDSPAGDYGVLYIALDPYCAFMESIGRSVLRTRFVPAGELIRRGLSSVRVLSALRFIDLVDSGGLTRLGTEGSLTSGTGYRNSQRWSEALRVHPVKADGIYYRSRHDQARVAAAVYDHCETSVKAGGAYVPWADQPDLLGAILDHYKLGTDL